LYGQKDVANSCNGSREVLFFPVKRGAIHVLSSNALSDAAGHYISSFLLQGGSIEELNLAGNRIGDIGVEFLAAALPVAKVVCILPLHFVTSAFTELARAQPAPHQHWATWSQLPGRCGADARSAVSQRRR